MTELINGWSRNMTQLNIEYLVRKKNLERRAKDKRHFYTVFHHLNE